MEFKHKVQSSRCNPRAVDGTGSLYQYTKCFQTYQIRIWRALPPGIWAQEGIRGLYAGLTVDVISNPFAQLLYYGNYELSKRYFQSSYSKYQANHPDLPTLETIGISFSAAFHHRSCATEPTAHMALGAWAELSSSLLYCPQDVISSRLQIQGNFPERERRYKSGAGNQSSSSFLFLNIDAIVKILRKEGLKGLYRGLGTHLMTEVSMIFVEPFLL